MARSRQLDRLVPSESSTSTSPERAADYDTYSFPETENDSESSVGVGSIRIMNEKDLPPVSRLPAELLIAIFSRLASTADLLSCMLVCRTWAMNCVGILWHRPTCSPWENLTSVANVLSSKDPYFQYHNLVKRLNLSGLHKSINDGTVLPFSVCRRIERLTLTGCSALTDKGVSDLVEQNHHLQALDVTDISSLTDHTLYKIAENCPRIQGLNLSGCTKITDDSLMVVAEACRYLKRIKLNAMAVDPISHQPVTSKVTDRAVIAFANNCPALLEVDLHACKQITSTSVVALLSTLRALRELRLPLCSEINNSAFLNLPPKKIYESLRILDLTECDQMRDEGVIRIINAAPRLRNLVLAKCRFITDRSVQAICKLGKNLHYVHLGHCSLITDAAVLQLIKSCNRIRYIDLACCNRLTDESVSQLSSLPKLKRIGLVKCQAITDRSILALAKGRHAASGPSSLERVHLSYCVNLTMKGIYSLLLHCGRLTHVSLTGVTAFQQESLTRFCRPAPEDFTPQQRAVFCVFSGDGVRQLREFMRRKFFGAIINENRDEHDDTETETETGHAFELGHGHDTGDGDGTVMYDDGDEIDEDEGHVTGLMHAAVIHDEDEEMTEALPNTQ